MDIMHRLEIRLARGDVLRALREDDLVRPWNPSARLQPGVVIEDERGAHLVWRVIDGPPEWLSTEVAFELSDAGPDDTVLLFRHKNWSEPSAAFARSSTMWAWALLALKSRLEAPEPTDLWEGAIG